MQALETAKTQACIMLGEIAKGIDPATGKRINVVSDVTLQEVLQKFLEYDEKTMGEPESIQQNENFIMIAGIARLGGLTRLELEKCTIEGADISPIIEGNPDLISVNLRGTTIGARSVATLTESQMEEIELDIDIPEEYLRTICRARNLKRVSIGDSNFRTPAETLREFGP